MKGINKASFLSSPNTSFSCYRLLELPPHHLVDNARVALDDLDNLRGNVFVGVVGDGGAVVAGGGHGDSVIDGLQ